MNKKSLNWGMGITVVWLAIIFIFWFFGDLKSPISLNELGDFLAGIVAPIAFLWLILGYVQQGKQLEQNSKSIRQQSESLQLQIEEFRKMVEIQVQQVEYRNQSAKPLFSFKSGSCIRKYELNEEDDYFDIYLSMCNLGKGDAYNIKILVDEEYHYEVYEIKRLTKDLTHEINFILNISSFDKFLDGMIYRKFLFLEFKDLYGNRVKEAFTLYIGRKENDMGASFIHVVEGRDIIYDEFVSS
ncbi:MULTISPECIES: hypothetical protein [unclassified Acinetobacter]|uniref:hypothetical protein n=1 Tax=unclassified Acinetobacter TaxID=196816 RepID=UPI001D17895C|nr:MULTISPECIES: hypothetical protein [unclassified Acinetobacter]